MHISYRTLLLPIVIGLFILSVATAQARWVKTYRWQIDVLRDKEKAESLAESVRNNGTLSVQVDSLEEGYYVTAGEFQEVEIAESARDELPLAYQDEAEIVEVLTTVFRHYNAYTLHHVQTDRYKDRQEAERVEEQLAEKGYRSARVVDADGYLTVRVGDFENRDQATRLLRELRNSGYPYCWTVQTQHEDSRVVQTVRSIKPVRRFDRDRLHVAGLDPDQEPSSTQYQVIVGPFDKRGEAEDLMLILKLKKYEHMRLVSRKGEYEIEIESPRGLESAERLVRAMRENGVVEAVFRKASQKERPPVPQVTTEGPRPTINKKDAQLTQQLEEQFEALKRQLEKLQQPSEEKTEKQRAQEHLRAADKLLESGDIEMARAQYALALQLVPTSEEALQGMTETLRMLREKRQQEEKEEALRLLLEAARELLSKEEYRAANLQYQKVLEIDPDNPEARLAMRKIRDHMEEQVAQVKKPSPTSERGPVRESPLEEEPFEEDIESEPAEEIAGREIPWLPIGVGAVVVIGALLFFVARKKSPVFEELPEEEPRQAGTFDISGEEEQKPAARSGDQMFADYYQAFKDASQPGGQQVPVEPAASSEPEVVSGPQTPSEPVAQGPPLKEPITVFVQRFEPDMAGKQPADWMGQYEDSTLEVYPEPEDLGGKPCLRLIKKKSEERTLYSMMLPESNPRATFEFEVCCESVNEHPMGLYLESVDDEELSIPVIFQKEADQEEHQATVGSSVFNCQPADWYQVRVEADFESGYYSVFFNKQPLEQQVSLGPNVKNLDVLSLSADGPAEGTFLISRIRVSRLP